MALGEELRVAREARKETTSEVAAATRMKIQIVEDLEDEEFGRIAAPIYGKGFIRLYAEHVGIDPQPLIQDYLQKLTGLRRPSLISDSTSSAPVPKKKPARAPAGDLFGEKAADKPETTADAAKAGGIPPKQQVRIPNPAASAKHVGSALGKASEQIRESASRCAAGVRDLWRTPQKEASGEPESMSPSRIASLILAALVFLVFVVSGASRLAGCRARPAAPSAGTVPEILYLADDPPEPYLD